MTEEEETRPATFADGRLLSKVRQLQTGPAFDNVPFAYTSGDPLAMAECLTFNQTIGFARNHPLGLHAEVHRVLPEVPATCSSAHGTRATWPSCGRFPPSRTTMRRAQLSAILTEQTLIQARIPFDLIFDEHVKDLSQVPRGDTPDSNASPTTRWRLRAGKGGGLVATPGGLCDRRKAPRQALLEGIVEGQRRGFGGGSGGGGRSAAAAPCRRLRPRRPARSSDGDECLPAAPVCSGSPASPEMERNFKIGGPVLEAAEEVGGPRGRRPVGLGLRSPSRSAARTSWWPTWFPSPKTPYSGYLVNFNAAAPPR